MSCIVFKGGENDVLEVNSERESGQGFPELELDDEDRRMYWKDQN